MNVGGIVSWVIIKCLDVVKVFVEVYLYFTKRSDNMVETSNVRVLYHYVSYNIIKNNKNYNVVFSSDIDENIERDILDFKQNRDIYLDAKNIIVNGELTSKCGNESNNYNLTKYIRHFCYYFDKDIKFDIFLHYLEYQHGLDLSLYKDMTIYMNDFNFSEKVYSINQLKNMSFREIFVKV